MTKKIGEGETASEGTQADQKTSAPTDTKVEFEKFVAEMAKISGDSRKMTKDA